MRLCFATNNKHKLQEVTSAVAKHFTIVSLDELSVTEDLPETQNTFEGNALQKARFLYHKLAVPCFADDSGLEVDALNGEPGVFSARYAGPQRNNNDNIDLLLTRLQGKTNRNARFKTVIALVGMGPEKVFEGRIEGRIIDEKRGTNGFGYDPVFVPDGHTKTFAEMSADEKNSISHRALAVQKLIQYLNEYRQVP